MEISVRVLCRTGADGILEEYLWFCEIVDAQRALYGMTGKAIEETIRICWQENVPESFLEFQKKKVVDIMYELYNQEKITEYVHYELMQKSHASVRGLMENTGWSTQRAMEAMKVPKNDYPKYLDRLAN